MIVTFSHPMGREATTSGRRRARVHPRLTALFSAGLILLLGSVGPMPVQSAPFGAVLDTWLGASGIPSEVVRALQARRQTDPAAQHWIVVRDGQVYSLAALSVDPVRQGVIKQAQRGLAEMRARQGLLLYAAGEHLERQGFANREAIAKALSALDNQANGRLLPGLQSRAGVLDGGVVALAWIPEDRIIASRERPPSSMQFLPAYCDAIYPTAQALYLEKRFADALSLYKEMHERQCAQPLAFFLDAAECFLALDKPLDAQRMADHLLSSFTSSLDSGQAERAGDVLDRAGDEDGARHAYELAFDLINGTGSGDWLQPRTATQPPR
ncbi:MAG: hypothetical protein KFB96_11590 [Thiocapsa sp.]|uniref:hypothetical protein n=1 Tax=Thiocapsa sp. TaxID=2024551 RepID=UPI001BD06219|nr:hypothetical protein [Thiocapsa sp.]QVL50984.1 MAG: hypothetical protein KFB96_11590 [Thiocapsa sp.]